MLLITLLLGAVVLYLINYWVNSYFNDWKKRGIPYSPSSSPFIFLFKFLFTKKGLMNIVAEDYEKMNGHRFAGVFQLFSPVILVRDPDLIHRMCVKDFSYFVDRSLPSDVSDFLTQSLDSTTGDKWRTLRHKMTPTFTSGKLKMMFQPITECCDEVVEYIDRKIGQDIEARDFMFKYSINVIGNVSFGLKVDAFNEETEKENEFLNMSRSFFNPSFLLIVKLMISMTMPKLRKILAFKTVDEKIVNFFNKLVKDMIKHREKSGEVRQDFLQLMLNQKRKEQEDSIDESNKTRETNSLKSHSEEPEDSELLDQLKYMQGENDSYKSMKVFTDDCIVAQAFMFISGGSETTAMALSFILFDLAANPRCQMKLQEEIDYVLSNNGLNYNAIKKMKYMEQFINESLRIHSISTAGIRVCTKNYRIPDSDVIIEKGTMVSFPVIGINRDPQYFPNPEKFDPNRFDELSATHPGVFLSFGTGPRMCIAKRLAIIKMKLLLTVVLKNFTVNLSSKTKLPITLEKSTFMNHVQGGLWIKFQKRNS